MMIKFIQVMTVMLIKRYKNNKINNMEIIVKKTENVVNKQNRVCSHQSDIFTPQ